MRAIQKAVEVIGDINGNKIADRITNFSSQNVPEIDSINRLNTTSQTEGAMPREIYTPPEICDT